MSVNNKFHFSQLFSVGFVLATTAARAFAQLSTQPTPVAAGTMTSGRLVASTAAFVGVIGVVIGVLAVFRPAGRFGSASGQLGARVAIGAGLISAVFGGFTAAKAGGIGTGGGLAGAIVAIVLGLISLALGAMAWSRSGSISRSQQTEEFNRN
jgi:hypothetical protein